MRAQSLPSLLGLSHQVLADFTLKLEKDKLDKRAEDYILLDATCGNGNDTLFLYGLGLRLVKSDLFKDRLRLLGFDLQKEAVDNTIKALSLEDEGLDFSIVCAGHEELSSFTHEKEKVLMAMYNLGYLPGSDKSIVTKAKSTLSSFELLKDKLVRGGLISVHAYGGHEGGLYELEKVETWFSSLPIKEWTVRSFKTLNKLRNPETLFLAEKLM